MKTSNELIAANKIILFQNKEKQKQASELLTVYKDLAFEIKERGKRAAELVIARKELVFQNSEKSKRAAELVIAKKELGFQNGEKSKRASELTIANVELVFQNREKEKRAAELVIANKELVFQNKEKEKRAVELLAANKELEQFAYIASHDLQEPLRTVCNYVKVFEEDYAKLLDDNARKYLDSINKTTERMSMLITSLLDFSRLGYNKILTKVDFKMLINEVITDLKALVKTSNALIEVTEIPSMNVYETEIRQVFHNLITNAIKFRKKNIRPEIKISSEKINDTLKFSVSDNGIGIDPIYSERIFDIFRRLETEEKYEGCGIGLANCKKIVQLHHGKIWVESIPERGSTFHFTIPHLTQ